MDRNEELLKAVKDWVDTYADDGDDVKEFYRQIVDSADECFGEIIEESK